MRTLVVTALVGCRGLWGIESPTRAVDASPLDARADAHPDSPPDAPPFASGTYGFEDLSAGNLANGFTFGNGIAFTAPSPNPADTQGLIVTDCSGNSGYFGFDCSTERTDIPDGFKFLGSAGLATDYPAIEITFPANIVSFGVAFTASDGTAGTSYAFDALDANGVLLHTIAKTTVALSSWRTNVATLTLSSGFRSVRITGPSVLVLDHLTWTK